MHALMQLSHADCQSADVEDIHDAFIITLPQASSLESLSKLFLVCRETRSRVGGRRKGTLGGALTAFLKDGKQCCPSRSIQELESVREVMRFGDAT